MDEHDESSHRGSEKAPVAFRFRDFYRRFYRNNLVVAIFSQIVIYGISTFIFIELKCFMAWQMSAIFAISFAIIFSLIVTIIAICVSLRPTKIASKILDDKAGVSLEPLNMSEPLFKQFGLGVFSSKLHRELGHLSKAPVSSADNSDAAALKALLDELPVGVIALSRDNQLIFANKNAPIAGNAIELDFSGKDESFRDFLNASRTNSIHAEKIWLRVQNRAPKDGQDDDSRRIFDVAANYNRDAPNGVETVLVTTDKTDFYREDEEGMDFVSLAAHELRGPITVIRGYLDILQDQNQNPTKQQQEIMDRLNVSAKRLASYISNILNASHYDHKHLKLNPERVKVTTLVDDVREDMELRAKTANRRVEFKVPEGLPDVAADRSSISEVLTNLIDNAVKYSRENGVVEVFAKAEDDFVYISVQDHGIGIPDNVADHLFDKFYRSHKSSGVVGGSGLGLYISRAIVESHGGHIMVKSTEGEGSTFTFTLPTFDSVADKLSDGNQDLIRSDQPQIINHDFIES